MKNFWGFVKSLLVIKKFYGLFEVLLFWVFFVFFRCNMVCIKFEIFINICGCYKLVLFKSIIFYYIYEKECEGDFYKDIGIMLKYD